MPRTWRSLKELTGKEVPGQKNCGNSCFLISAKGGNQDLKHKAEKAEKRSWGGNEKCTVQTLLFIVGLF